MSEGFIDELRNALDVDLQLGSRHPSCRHRGRSRGGRRAARYCAALAGLVSAMARSGAVLSVSGSEPVAIGSAGDDGNF